MDKNGKGVIFDPASWWADNEVDIAMTKLFGGFRKEFYEEYHRIFPTKNKKDIKRISWAKLKSEWTTGWLRLPKDKD